ncbi:MAG: serine protease [Actinobacteria bacterium]|nr:serine protease [Actinomycetota bacterium]
MKKKYIIVLLILITFLLSFLISCVDNSKQEIEQLKKEIEELKSKEEIKEKKEEEYSLGNIVNSISDSIFFIETSEGIGTAFVVYSDTRFTYLVTANHVVEKSSRARARNYSSNFEYPSKFYSSDPYNDLALLIIETGSIESIIWANENNHIPKIGDDIIIIGNPLGISGTVTKGIISYLDNSYIQTDAALNPGNSGSPMLNKYGEVLGVIVMKAMLDEKSFAEGISFAIRIEALLNKLLTDNKVPTDSEIYSASKTIETEQKNNQTDEEYSFVQNVYNLLDEYNLAFNHLRVYHGENWIYNDPNHVALEDTVLVKFREYANKLRDFSCPKSYATHKDNLIKIADEIYTYKEAQINCMKNNDWDGNVKYHNLFSNSVDSLFNYYNNMIKQ